MKNKKVLIFLITYKAKTRVVKAFNGIPFKKLKKYVVDVLISDDASNDKTVDYIKGIRGKNVIKKFNKINLGYGGNIKKCLKYSLNNDYDYAIMLHGDAQYHPRYIPSMLKKIQSNPKIKAVTGSRMKNKKDALKGRMPIYKFIGNILLTKITNILLRSNFSDCHTGYWIYSTNALKKININDMTNSLNFDQQMRFKFIKKKLLISEIPIKTIYAEERSSVHLLYAIKYFLKLLYFYLFQRY